MSMTIVKQIREAGRLTQSELAELGGTSQPTIAAYESGAKVPSLRTLRRLAGAAGFELDLGITPPLTREERRSLYLHRAIVRRLVEDPFSSRKTGNQSHGYLLPRNLVLY